MTKKTKCKIVPMPNGPLYYLNDFEPHKVEGLVNNKEETLSHISGTALCRCGKSSNKPFCDGAHSAAGFSDKNECDGKLNKRIDYTGKDITIHDNRGICSHAGYCTDKLSKVFKISEEPWIDPDGATTEQIIETVRSCPSGALSYSIDGKEDRDYNHEPQIRVSKDGPYNLCGNIEVVGHNDRAEKVSEEHCSLCRCGSSKNKPFCDGSHWDAGFKDGK